jgi:4-hydroxy-4-methyl-2-oxoglutarate aldolase
MTDKEMLEAVRALRLADLGDGMDALGLVDRGTMNPDMRPIRPGIRFAGFAYTVKLVPAQDRPKVWSSVDEYMQRLGEWCSDTYTFMGGLVNGQAQDKVCVMDLGGYPGGVWGSEIAMNTLKSGLVGAVIDGGCRDSYECNLEQVNVHCTKRTFNHVYGRLRNGGVGVPIECAGVLVNPGDIICADDDGVLVIPRDRVQDVVDIANAVLKADQKTRAKHYKDLGFQPDDTLGDAVS